VKIRISAHPVAAIGQRPEATNPKRDGSTRERHADLSRSEDFEGQRAVRANAGHTAHEGTCPPSPRKEALRNRSRAGEGESPGRDETPGEHRGSRPDGDIGGSPRTPEWSKTLETNDVSHRASAVNVRRVKGADEATRLLRREKL
jgi:hypothetical protein